jgi:hypothetical protein
VKPEPQDPELLGKAMAFVFQLAWVADKLAWLMRKRWRELSKGNPK